MTAVVCQARHPRLLAISGLSLDALGLKEYFMGCNCRTPVTVTANRTIPSFEVRHLLPGVNLSIGCVYRKLVVSYGVLFV